MAEVTLVTGDPREACEAGASPGDVTSPSGYEAVDELLRSHGRRRRGCK